MAHRKDIAYIGAFADVSSGIDTEGELFRTIADAKAALEARHRSGGWVSLPVTREDGWVHEEIFTPLTNEAHIMLWRFDPVSLIGFQQAHEHGTPPPATLKDWQEHTPDVVVWVGARQGIRHGSLAQFEAQQRERNRQAVREAGSVVVTD